MTSLALRGSGTTSVTGAPQLSKSCRAHRPPVTPPAAAATRTEPTRGRHGADTGPTRGRHGADTGPTRGRHGADTGPTRGRSARAANPITSARRRAPPQATGAEDWKTSARQRRLYWQLNDSVCQSTHADTVTPAETEITSTGRLVVGRPSGSNYTSDREPIRATSPSAAGHQSNTSPPSARPPALRAASCRCALHTQSDREANVSGYHLTAANRLTGEEKTQNSATAVWRGVTPCRRVIVTSTPLLQ